MGRRLVLLAAVLALAAPACGDDDGSVFEGTPGTVPDSLGTIVVETGDRAWELPAAVCLRTDGDRAAVVAAAQQEAAEVRHLVNGLVSGWPTTTYALDFDYQSYERDLNTAGVAALTLAGLVGEQAELERAWADWEQAYGSPDEGWGPPDEIAGRLDAWKTEAGALTGAVADYCAP